MNGEPPPLEETIDEGSGDEEEREELMSKAKDDLAMMQEDCMKILSDQEQKIMQAKSESKG